MKTQLVLFVCFATVTSIIENRYDLTNDNKIPKKAYVHFNSVCDECQSLIQRVVAVASDPGKLAELKLLLGALCHETSYEQECRIFVSKLDLFLGKLLPYLKDSHKVCVEMHLCRNSELDAFHRIALAFANRYISVAGDVKAGLICDECKFGATELQKAVDRPEFQADLRKFLSDNVCKHLGQYQGSCDVLVDDFLPELFHEVHQLLNDPENFCQQLKLCKSDKKLITEKAAVPTVPVFKNMMQRLGAISTKTTSGLGCLQCKIMGGLVLNHLKKDENTKNLADDLKNLVCPILPKTWLPNCNDFLDFYAQPVVKLALSEVTAELLCETIHACKKKKSLVQYSPIPETMPERCQICKEYSEALSSELKDVTVRQGLVQEAKHNLCHRVPLIGDSCRQVAQNFMSTVLSKTLSYTEGDRFCEIINQC